MKLTSRGRAARLLAATAAVVTAGAAFAVVALNAGTASAAAAGTGTGFLSARGSQLVDATGNPVRLTGINWFGMETDNKTFHGLWSSESWRSQLDHMATLGFNTLRVPFSNDALRPGAVATGINDYVNPDLVGNSPLQILDKVIAYAGSKGMRVLLDRHRPTSAGQSALWYVPSVPESTWINDWKMLAERYRGNPIVIGADLHNEPHAMGTDPNGTGACWGCGDPARDWRLAAERAGNAILAVNPDWLIVVEGVSCLSGADANVWDNIPDEPCGWWGGNLSRAGTHPVRLSNQSKLVYSPHEYATSVYRQKWFDDPTYPANMPAIWDHFWGYIERENIAPLLFGEYGSTLQDPKDAIWLRELMRYMGTGVTGADFTYWSWNPNSGDTGGIVQDDWRTVQQAKYDILRPYLIAPVPGSIGGSTGGGSGSQSPGNQSPAAGACTATVTVGSPWPQGFQAAVRVTNTGSSPVSPWTATFTVPAGATVNNGWGGTVTQSGTTVTAAAPGWAPALAPGASVEIGFTAAGPSTPAPGGVRLNGVACA
ncbi:MAG TPA: cellulase family glycosylhydrolase [Micromonosporaceae bacterium]|nr:cellulase family glycosylhydrolase [Micromonosporaceae bacterium]